MMARGTPPWPEPGAPEAICTRGCGYPAHWGECPPPQPTPPLAGIRGIHLRTEPTDSGVGAHVIVSVLLDDGREVDVIRSYTSGDHPDTIISHFVTENGIRAALAKLQSVQPVGGGVRYQGASRSLPSGAPESAAGEAEPSAAERERLIEELRQIGEWSVNPDTPSTILIGGKDGRRISVSWSSSTRIEDALAELVASSLVKIIAPPEHSADVRGLSGPATTINTGTPTNNDDGGQNRGAE